MGLSLPRVFAAEDASAPFQNAKAESVIFLFLFGGPSQLETFDMKPDAPAEIRGPFMPTQCRMPGLLMSDQLPGLAKLSHKNSVIRTMTHSFNDHSGAGHYLQMAGGGIRGGAVYGTIDGKAAYPTEHPVSPEYLAKTIYWSLGIDPELMIHDREGRPVPIVESGKPVTALFG